MDIGTNLIRSYLATNSTIEITTINSYKLRIHDGSEVTIQDYLAAAIRRGRVLLPILPQGRCSFGHHYQVVRQPGQAEAFDTLPGSGGLGERPRSADVKLFRHSLRSYFSSWDFFKI